MLPPIEHELSYMAMVTEYRYGKLLTISDIAFVLDFVINTLILAKCLISFLKFISKDDSWVIKDNIESRDLFYKLPHCITLQSPSE